MATLKELMGFKQIAIRSDGAKFLEGERNDAMPTPWLSVVSGKVTLQKGLYDELLVIKGEVTNDQIKMWAAMQSPFFDPTPVVQDSQIPSADKWDQAASDAEQALGDAGDAKTVANSKARTFYQATPPTASGVGDVWINTSDYNRMYRWDGTAWLDANNNSPIDAGDRPVTAGGGRVLIDNQGAFGYGINGVKRAGFGTDGRWIAGAGAVTADELGLMIKDLVSQEMRLHLGNIGGQPWGNGVLAPNTYGLWGDRAGLYLRGYASLLVVQTCQDGDILRVDPEIILSNPQVILTARDSLIYHQNMTERVNLATSPERISEREWKINAKLVLRGKGRTWLWDPVPLAAKTNPEIYDRKVPTGAECDYITCRPGWEIVSTKGWVKFSMRITNEFGSGDTPINWRTVQSSHTVASVGVGTLNWDMAVPQGRWAIRIVGEQYGPFGWPSKFGVPTWNYSLGNRYLNNDGEIISGTDPSGVHVLVQIFNQG